MFKKVLFISFLFFNTGLFSSKRLPLLLHFYKEHKKEWFDKYKFYSLYGTFLLSSSLFELYFDEKLYKYRVQKYPHLHKNENEDEDIPPYQ